MIQTWTQVTGRSVYLCRSCQSMSGDAIVAVGGLTPIQRTLHSWSDWVDSCINNRLVQMFSTLVWPETPKQWTCYQVCPSPPVQRWYRRREECSPSGLCCPEPSWRCCSKKIKHKLVDVCIVPSFTVKGTLHQAVSFALFYTSVCRGMVTDDM